MLNIRFPYSKSELNRILILGSQLKDKLVIRGNSSADDIQTLQKALECLGCRFDYAGEYTVIDSSSGISDRGEVFIKDSATGFRLLLALLAAQPGGEYLLDASAQLRKRPMLPLVETLRSMGASINNDKFPYNISGTCLNGRKACIDTSQSSQYLSALLLAAPQFSKGLDIEISGERVSWEYVELTIKILAEMGIKVYQEQNRLIVPSGSRLINPGEIDVEIDYSAAGYFLAMAAVNGRSVSVPGNRSKSLQPDSAFADILSEMGAEVIDNEGSTTLRGRSLRGITINMSRMPDQVPTLAVLGLLASSEVEITGISHLQYKESNRIESVITEIRRCGGKAEYIDGCLRIYPLEIDPGHVVIDTHGDHRLAMAFAILQLKYHDIVIDDHTVVNKSFPDFWTEFRKFKDSE